jgi:hypothetical protein
MSYEAAMQTAKYAHVTGCPVQITHEGRSEWNAYFKSKPHAQTCYEELRADSHEVTLEGDSMMRIK